MTIEATNCNRSFAAKAQSLAAGFDSTVIDFKDMPLGSIHIFWSSVVGATPYTGAFKIYGSNRPEVSSFDLDGTLIDGAEITPHNANGSRLWIRERIGFRYALIRWTPGNVTSGTCDIIAIGKKT